MPEVNISRFTGFADIYDSFRPRPPVHVPQLILSLIDSAHASVVVDLGSGTGLSTSVWRDYADEIIGIEPNDDMRAQAEMNHAGRGIRYINASSYNTTLQSESADIVTCSQSFHWMEPEPTLAECARILKHGGIVAVYDNDWPPAVGWNVEKSWTDLFTEVKRLTAKHTAILHPDEQRSKEKHLDNIRNSGHFLFCRELVFHNTEECDGERFINLAVSQGAIQALLKAEIGEITEALAKFEAATRSYFGASSKPMQVGYRMRYGIRN